MNLKKFLKIKVASLKRCGVVRMLAKKKLKKKHQQHHVVSPMNKKEFQTHVFVVEKKRKNLRSEEHTSELQSRFDLVCRLLLEKKNERKDTHTTRQRSI